MKCKVHGCVMVCPRCEASRRGRLGGIKRARRLTHAEMSAIAAKGGVKTVKRKRSHLKYTGTAKCPTCKRTAARCTGMPISEMPPVTAATPLSQT